MPLNVSIESWAGFGLLIMLAVFVGLALARRATERRVSLRDVTRARRARTRDETDIRDNLDQLLERLEAFSRAVDGQLDAKLARIETVMRAADERTVRLEHLLAAHDQRAMDWAAGRRSTRRGTADDASAGRHAAPPAEQPGQPRAESGPERPATLTPALAAAPSGARAAPPRNDPRFAGVYDLADAGVPALNIAARLGIPAGEVELILNLRSLG